jgi:hypothetical protein
MNPAGRRRAGAADIRRALRLLVWASIVHAGAYALLAIAL